MNHWFWAIVLFVGGCGGEDPVLKAAREAASQVQGNGRSMDLRVEQNQERAPSGPGGHPIDGGMAMQPPQDQGGRSGTPGAPLTPGIPEEPEPGNPLSPSPGTPQAPTPGLPGDPEPGIAGESDDVGPMVRVRGHVAMLDYRTGPIRVDVFDGDHRSHVGQRPSLIRSARMKGPGGFEFDLPLSAEKVWIEASNDENEDGRPGPRDPSGRYPRNPVMLSADGVGDIRIQLQRQEPPPGGSGAEL